MENPICPECGQKNVTEILYGYYANVDADFEKDIESGKIALGGCSVSDDDTRWMCNSCAHRWGKVDHDK